MEDLVPNSLALSTDLVAKAREFAAASRSDRTRHEYRRAFGAFVSWCELHAFQPGRPETVALYLTARAEAGKSVSTIEQDLAAISAAHRLAGLTSPRQAAVVREVRAGIRRLLGVAPKQKAPLLAEDLRAIAMALPSTLRGLRDRALLLLGFAGGFRRSELVALSVEDVTPAPEGLRLRLRRSKTDQEGEGRPLGIPFGSTTETCPVRALATWLEAAHITIGPLFRRISPSGGVGESLSGRAVARIVKRAALLAGLDPRLFAGHSLRSGLVTSAARAGKAERDIMRHTGHRSSVIVRRYIHEAGVFSDNAADGLL